MVEHWLENSGNNCPDGYEVIDGAGFLMRAHDVIGAIPEWDEIRRIHDWAMTRNPYLKATPLYGSNLWMRRIEYRFLPVLFYRIDEENCQVIFEDLRRMDQM